MSRAMDLEDNGTGTRDRRSPETVQVTSTLKEIGGRITKLSYADMVSFATLLSAELAMTNGPFPIAEALIKVAQKIDAQPTSDKIEAKPRAASDAKPRVNSVGSYKENW